MSYCKPSFLLPSSSFAHFPSYPLPLLLIRGDLSVGAHLAYCFEAFRPDSHAVERAPDEVERDEEECEGQQLVDRGVAVAARPQSFGKLYGEKAEERGELNDGVQRDRRSILEGIANGIANDRRIMQSRTLLLQLNFDNLLRVVPRAARVRHEDGLIEAEDGD